VPVHPQGRGEVLIDPILTIFTAVFLTILALLGAPAGGLFSISSMLTLELLAFGFVYELLALYRVRRAAR
jgi:hypothetical protein